MSGDPKDLRGVGTTARSILFAFGIAALAADLLLRSGARSVWLTAAIVLAVAIVTSLVSWIAYGVRRASRRNTTRFGLPREEFSAWGLLSSRTWDSLSIMALVVGVSVLGAGLVESPRAHTLVQNALRFIRHLAG